MFTLALGTAQHRIVAWSKRYWCAASVSERRPSWPYGKLLEEPETCCYPNYRLACAQTVFEDRLPRMLQRNLHRGDQPERVMDGW